MMRLSYSTNSDGNLVSNLFPLHSDMAFVIIFVKEKRLEVRAICDDGTVKMLSECSGRDIRQCKLRARKEAVRLGVIFTDEIRKKK